jgi:ribosomal protein S18 acetylase RimI-like enzyme
MRSVRLLSKEDSIEGLTALLHRAYAPLAALGFRYTATYQNADTTRSRAAKGECYVVVRDQQIIGTITLVPPSVRSASCEWYDRPEVAVLSQFAIEPEYQRRGWGSELMLVGEARAKELGAAEVSVDTAEGAEHLIRFYERRGYRHVGHAQWSSTNYRSVLLSKSIR